MAPRTAKAKKATNLVESDAPKKARGKAKAIEDPLPDPIEVAESETHIVEKKTKRKKAAIESNGQEETNGVDEAPPAKKGRKKNTPDVAAEEKSVSTNGNSGDESPIRDEIDDEGETVDHPREEQPTVNGKGRKKPAKKEVTKKTSSTEAKGMGRGKKNAKQESNVTEKDGEAKQKPAAKNRGRKAQQKVEEEPEDDIVDEEAKPEPPLKGKKRGHAKPAKEKTPESDKEEPQEDNDIQIEKPAESKKKETKGKKGQGKKVTIKQQDPDEDDGVKEEPATKKRKVAKKDGKGDVNNEQIGDIAEVRPAKGKRGQKKAAETDDTEGAKRGRKPTEEKATSEEVKKKAVSKNKVETSYHEIDFSNYSKNPQSKEWNFKIASWNVDGIRACMNKGGLDYIKYEKPDILCVQEIKCSKEKLPDEIANMPGYHAYWHCSEKDGYAGVGIYTTKLAMNVQYGLQNEEFDNEGRIITAEYEQFYLICTYVPNAGRKLVTLPKRLQWNEAFRNHVKELDKKKPVIICGDLNVAHNEIDLTNPKPNKRNAGFTDEERSGMTELLGDGFVDTYRHLNPDRTGAYTFWSFMANSRAKNVGWRLDYFLMSKRLMPSLCDSVIRSEVYGSDHCPISLFFHLTSADKPKE